MLFSLPVVVTYAMLSFLFRKIDSIAQPLAQHLLTCLPYNCYNVTYIPGLGIVITIVFIFLMGIFVTNIIGRKMIDIGERIIGRIPIVNSVYRASKQFLEAVSITNKHSLNKVVLIEYPRKGIYSVGFITSPAKGQIKQITRDAREEVVNIFIPTTPNPTSGMFVMLPEDNVIPLSMTVEEGIKLVVSGGMITPPIKRETEEEEIIGG